MRRFGYLTDFDNLAISDAVGITASSAASGFPAAALLRGQPWRSFGVVSEWVEFDLSAANNVDLALIRTHNMSETATIGIKGGATANPSTFSGTITWREFDAFLVFAAQQNYRYWRFTFDDPENEFGFIQIGGFGLGQLTIPDVYFLWESRYTPEIRTRRHETAYLVPRVEEVSRRVRLELPFELLDAERNVIIDLHRRVGQDRTPLFLIPNLDEYEGYYGRLGPLEQINGPSARVVLEFTEDGRGNIMAL